MNPDDLPAPPQPTAAALPALTPAAAGGSQRALWIVLGIAAALALGGIAMAWQTWQRVQLLEQELVRRQQDSTTLATEARVLAKEAHDVSRDAAAKVALAEARIAENAMQRSQLEDLIQALSRSRDENMLADIDAALRVAVQQSTLTGSTEPLLATLKQAEERLARNAQPRVERVRRAVAHDLDRVRAVGVSDIATLLIKLDDVVRIVDELPLLAQPERRGAAGDAAVRGRAGVSPATAPPAARTPPAAASTPSPAPAPAPATGWRAELAQAWAALTEGIWSEARSLVRVTPIQHPEAALLVPEQAYFLRENIKLRLLNARLALLSRQFAIAQADLRDVQSALERYFDRSNRRVTTATELVRQVAAQSRGVVVPRPDETLAALTAALAGR